MEYYLDLLYTWQELVGAFLGSSLAIILSGIGYLVKKRLEHRQEKKETLRRIEVDLAYALNSTYVEGQKLQEFVRRMRELITLIRAITSPTEFAMQTINFPTIVGIHTDNDFVNFRINSYYLHNKLLWIHAGTQDTNGTLLSLKDDYTRILKLNETMISLMTTTGPNPVKQRASYIENLKGFADEIERFCNEELPNGIKTIVQAKVYNEKLRRPWGVGRLIRYKYEGVNFKYFRKLEKFKRFARNLESIERIDAEIEEDVQTTIAEAKRRAEKLKNS